MAFDKDYLMRKLDEGMSSEDLAKAFADTLNEAEKEYRDYKAKEAEKQSHLDLMRKNFKDGIEIYLTKILGVDPGIFDADEFAKGLVDGLLSDVNPMKHAAKPMSTIHKTNSPDLKVSDLFSEELFDPEKLKNSGWKVTVLEDKDTPSEKVRRFVARYDK